MARTKQQIQAAADKLTALFPPEEPSDLAETVAYVVGDLAARFRRPAQQDYWRTLALYIGDTIEEHREEEE